MIRFLTALIFVFPLFAQAELVSYEMTLNFSHDKPSASMPWIGVDLASKLTTSSPKFNAPGWHIRFKQAYVSTNGGRVAVVQTKDFASVKRAPEDAMLYVADSESKRGPNGRDIYNDVLSDGFDYRFFAGHLFAVLPQVFVLQTADGHFVKVQFVDFIKDGKAIREVREKDWLGRERLKEKAVQVADDDGQVHVVFKVKYNTVAGDRALE